MVITTITTTIVRNKNKINMLLVSKRSYRGE